MLPVAILAALIQPADRADAVAAWQAAVDPVLAEALPDGATLAQRIAWLVARDEITRQHAWRAWDARLTPAEQEAAGQEIGTRMRAIDRANTEALKRLLPADGWFRNSRDGRQVTHGAWLIAQHSPDTAFRAAVLEAMRSRVANGDVDAQDFAMIADRVARNRGEPQIYGSQARCLDGVTAIQPMIDPAAVDDRRAAIGWSKSYAETLGDLEIGKPCAI